MPGLRQTLRSWSSKFEPQSKESLSLGTRRWRFALFRASGPAGRSRPIAMPSPSNAAPAAFIPDLLFGRRRARFLLHIVTEQHILITQIKSSARDHGMAEGGETAPVRLPEPAFL